MHFAYAGNQHFTGFLMFFNGKGRIFFCQAVEAREYLILLPFSF
jgi:hypothetical protein